MFAGHLGAALALKSVDRRVGLGALMFAALLPDLLLWIFVMLRIETVVVPPEYPSLHYLSFVFPWSHGLAASVLWSAAAGGVTWAVAGRAIARPGRIAAVIAAAVFSHCILDVLVHPPEIPILGPDSPKIGLGLWRRMPLALEIELAITAAGVWIALRGSGLRPRRAAGLAAAVGLAAALTVAGGTIAPPPPTAGAVALPGLVSILALTGIGFWADRD